MNHEELLAKVDTPREFLGVLYAPDWQRWALRAVVELHKPEMSRFGNEDDSYSLQCIECYATYPCPTIQAIEKEYNR